MCFKVLIVIAVLEAVGCLPFEHNRPCGIEASSNPLHQDPWVVYLEYLQHGHLNPVRCAASLIDRRHLITAAHCIRHPKFDTMKARLGEYDIEHGRDCIDGVCTDRIVTIQVACMTVHPGYDGKENDIAVLTLKTDAPYTDFIRPVCLPSGEFKEDAVFTAAGWGVIPKTGEYSAVKKSIKLPFFKTVDCVDAFGERALPKNVICAGGEPGIDTCSGDSGGPLTTKDTHAVLRGVTSSGNVHCGTGGIPGIYTNVAYHLDWVNSVLNTEKCVST